MHDSPDTLDDPCAPGGPGVPGRHDSPDAPGRPDAPTGDAAPSIGARLHSAARAVGGGAASLRASAAADRAVRARARELEDHMSATAEMRDELDDRERILSDFDATVSAQRALLATLAGDADSLRAERARAEEELASLKSELSALEAANRAFLDDMAGELEEQAAALPDGDVRAARRAAKRSLRGERSAREGDERALTERIDGVRADIGAIDSALEDNRISQEAAQQRLGYCAQVHDSPARTDELRERIASRERDEAALRDEVAALDAERSNARDRARLARRFVIAAIAAVAVIAVVVCVVVL